MTTWNLALSGTAVNAYLVYCAVRFFRERTDDTARRLFLVSNVHLPVLLILFMLHKTSTAPPPEHNDPVVMCHDAIMEVNSPME
jgi:heme O synthase-like polyprenyltransferase